MNGPMTETTYDRANLWLARSVPGVSIAERVGSLGFQSQPYTSLLWFRARQVPSLRRSSLEMMLTRALLAPQAGVTDRQSLSKPYMAMQPALRPLARAGQAAKGKPREASSWELLPCLRCPG